MRWLPNKVIDMTKAKKQMKNRDRVHIMNGIRCYQGKIAKLKEQLALLEDQIEYNQSS